MRAARLALALIAFAAIPESVRAAEVTGGSGGAVIQVTTLADSGPGSLREAIDADGPRVVVFRVAGVIELETPLIIDDPHLTVAGQTAPLPGITIAATRMESTPIFIGTANVVLSHLRVRPGGEAAGPYKDAIAVGEGIGPVDGVVIEHCSLSWSNDETFSIWSDEHPVTNVTLRDCIVSEALDYDDHSRGAIVGSNTMSDRITGVRMERNLFAHNSGRNAYLKVCDARFVNNIVYNWGGLATQIAGGTRADVVGNLYIPGADSSGRSEIVIRMSEPWAGHNWGPPGEPSLHVAGNAGPGQPDPAGDQRETMCEVAGYGNGWGWPGDPPAKRRPPAAWFRDEPLPSLAGERPILDARTLEDALLPAVGMSRVLDELGRWTDARDAIDARTVSDVRNRTGRIIDRPTTTAAEALPAAGEPYADTDADGMPDAYEDAHSLDPTDPADAWGDVDGDGVLNLDAFLAKMRK